MSEYDPELGQQVHKHLVSLGIETPFYTDKRTSPNQKITMIETLVSEIMEELYLDMTDDSLKDTPARVAKMYCEEIFSGLDYNHFPKCTSVENKMRYDEVVLERNCIIRSMCEHHLLPIYGVAHIGYVANGKVIGISKLNRVVTFFASRPQVQERLTEQVYAALSLILKTEDVAVVIEADHFCSKLRGVKDHSCDTVTSKMGGRFRQVPALREELLLLIGRK